ncbi:hypothetical protein LTR70_009232 [Exophiala xenobiotica]|nr:hypothetical protein LTR70_009232 [Exophiala xenobiotica]
MSKYNIHLGKSAGLDTVSISTRYAEVQERRSTPSSAERMQLMGHDDPNMYQRYYLNQVITTDTFACSLGTPSRQNIMKLASHMSLTRDVNAPTALSDAQKWEVRSDPAYCQVRESRDTARAALDKCGKLKAAKVLVPQAYADYKYHCRLLDAVEKQLSNSKLQEIRGQFFASAGARYIEQQHRSQSDSDGSKFTCAGPQVEIAERNRIRDLLFGKTSQLSDLVEAFRALCSRVDRQSGTAVTYFEPLEDADPLESLRAVPLCEQYPDLYQQKVPGLVCLFCLGNSALNPSARTFSYARRTCLARHVQHQHLRYQSEPFVCPHPNCSVPLRDGDHFKNHAYLVHSVAH